LRRAVVVAVVVVVGGLLAVVDEGVEGYPGELSSSSEDVFD
jgi:uncharacterized membrane protein